MKLIATTTPHRGQTFPSQHAEGDIVHFEPHLDAINAKTMRSTEAEYPNTLTLAKVVGVKFYPGKVCYDLAVQDVESPTGFYEARPLRDVDSFMVLKRDPA